MEEGQDEDQKDDEARKDVERRGILWRTVEEDEMWKDRLVGEAEYTFRPAAETEEDVVYMYLYGARNAVLQ